jgi:ferrous iron transport protein A
MLNTLNNIKINDTVRVKSITEACHIKRRLLDIGLIPGTNITLLYTSPFKDPKAYLIRNTIIAIRDIDAKEIEVSYE